MKIIPAIDLMAGRCVQLVGGDPDTKKDFGDPVKRAQRWVDGGADMLHVVDLDATLGLGDNLGVVSEIRRAVEVPIEFGGGIRSVEKAVEVLAALGPYDKIIVGTMAVSDYPMFRRLEMLSDYKYRVIVSVDSKGGFVAVKGWQEKSELGAGQLIRSCEDLVWGFLFTNVDVEGRMMGVDESVIKEVVSVTKRPVIVSGGITTVDDVRCCERAGAWGVVLGKALYEGRITLEELV